MMPKHFDAPRAQMLAGSDAGQHQELRRVEGAAAQNDLRPRHDLMLGPALR
jgi:hypothetical protein